MTKPFYLTIGLDPATVGGMIEKLRKTRGVVSLDLTDAPRKAKPNGADGAAKPRGAYPRGAFAASGHDAVLDLLFGNPPMGTQQLREAFEAQGRSRASIASVIHAMKKAGEIALTDQGYKLTRKMADRMRHRKSAKTK